RGPATARPDPPPETQAPAAPSAVDPFRASARTRYSPGRSSGTDAANRPLASADVRSFTGCSAPSGPVIVTFTSAPATGLNVASRAVISIVADSPASAASGATIPS